MKITDLKPLLNFDIIIFIVMVQIIKTMGILCLVQVVFMSTKFVNVLKKNLTKKDSFRITGIHRLSLENLELFLNETD